MQVTYDDGDAQVDDPYRFLPTLGEVDLHLINEGRHEQLWEVLGAQVHHYPDALDPVDVVRRVGPQRLGRSGSRATSTDWDGREHPMRQLGTSGIWELFVPGVGIGTDYKYPDPRRRRAGGVEKADPMAAFTPSARRTRRRRSSSRPIQWGDDDWISARADKQPVAEPMSIYEVHLASWRRHLHRGPAASDQIYSWEEMAEELPAYLVRPGLHPRRSSCR